jgi:hypothetical protein
MAKATRTPSPAKVSRAGKDAHSKSAATRKEAMEVLALAPRKTPPKKSK